MNILNKSLPYFLDQKKRKWLVDTGSAKNYMHPSLVSPEITRYKEDFIVKTPNGESKGNEYIFFNTENVFSQPHRIKMYIFDFSTKYDILLGNETLRAFKMNVNFANDKLEYKDGMKELLFLLDNKSVTLQPGYNVISIPVKSAPNVTTGLIKEVNTDVYTVEEGIVEITDNKCKCVVFSNELLTIYPEPMDVEDVEEIIEPKQFTTNCPENLADIIQDIPSLLRTSHMNEEEKLKIISLVQQFPEIIKRENDPLSSTNLLKHTINTKDDLPVYTKNYRYPQIYREDIEFEIDKLLKNKIIQHSNSPYNSPIWVVPKKPDASGKRKIRMVLDYRKLNDKTIDDKFPLPNIEDLFGKIGRATYFSAIDLASGFHQIQMDPQSVPKTAFSTEHGHYEFLRMPFGLKNAPPTFQRAMNIIFSRMTNVLVYMDDIIIFSDSLEEHLKHLKSAFTKLKEHNLKIQLDKTEFFKRELLYLGHIISEKGVMPNPSKVEAIKNFPIPKTAKEIKQFLGLTGYYRKMIRNYAKIAKPLTAALRKDVKINPNSKDYREAFENLKLMLQNSPILQLPDFSKQFLVTTDASNFAIGGVLSQKFDGNDLPIAYASRTLNKSEVNLSTIEKELLAIVWVCKHFRPYLYGRKFLIQTDHKPLQWLRNIKEPNSKLLRWKLLLDEFDFEINYVQGKTNHVADALSRIPSQPINLMDNDDNDFLGFGNEDLPFHGFDDINVDDLIQLNSNDDPPPIDDPNGYLDDIANALTRFNNQDDANANTSEPHDMENNDCGTGSSVFDMNDYILLREDNADHTDTHQPTKEIDDNALPIHNDTDSLVTIHSADSSNEQIQIVDDDKILNVEHNQILIERGNKTPTLQKIFDKNRLLLCFQDPLDFEHINKFCLEYLKPNTTYGVYCSKDGLLSNQYESMFNNFAKVIKESFNSVKIKRYKKVNLDITDPDEQKEVVSNYHTGKTYHRGISESYSHIRRRYYWPSMMRDITNFINKCPICLKTKYERRPIRAEYKVSPTPTKPFEKLQLDAFQYDKRKFLSIIDCFSKRLVVYPLTSLNQIEVKDHLFDYFSLYPTPKIVQMDNGREFDNAGLRDFLKLYEVEPYYVTPGHPDSQGLIERTHSTLIELLNSIQLQNRNNTTEANMKTAVIAFNNTLNSTLKMTPMEITFGISENSFLNDTTEQLITEERTKEYHDRLQLIHRLVKDKVEMEKQTRTELLNKNRETDVEIPEAPFIKTTFNKKNKPKFFQVQYDKQQNVATNSRAIQKRPFKIHPNRMKRPRKIVKKKNNKFVSEQDDPHSPAAGPSNVV